MSTYARSQETLVIVVVAAILCAMGVKACASALGLPWLTMLQIMVSTLTVIGLAFMSARFGGDWPYFRLSVAWPALVGLFIAAWWPALDAWNTIISLPSPLDYDHSNYVVQGDAFWDTGWFKWSVEAVFGAAYVWLCKRDMS